MIAILRHKVGNTYTQLLLNYLISKSELFLQMVNIVVSLFNVKLCPILLPLEVDLLHV